MMQLSDRNYDSSVKVPERQTDWSTRNLSWFDLTWLTYLQEMEKKAIAKSHLLFEHWYCVFDADLGSVEHTFWLKL